MFTATLEDKILLAQFEGYAIQDSYTSNGRVLVVSPSMHGGMRPVREEESIISATIDLWRCILGDIHYDSNWLDLMRIIDKIEEQKGVSLYISKYECVLQYEDAFVVNAKFKCDDESFTKIQQAYTVCVEYIKSLQK